MENIHHELFTTNRNEVKIHTIFINKIIFFLNIKGWIEVIRKNQKIEKTSVYADEQFIIITASGWANS